MRGEMGNTDAESVSDLELFEKTSDGDEDAFVQIVDRYKDRLYGFLRRMVSDSSDAEDLLQQTFLRVYKKSLDHCRINSFSSWIFTVAANLARDELRRRARIGRRTFTLDDGYAETIADKKAVTVEEVAYSELRERVDWAVGCLNETYRAVFVLRDIEGMSYEEIAMVLKIRIGTVKSRLNRARLKLRVLLAPYIKEESADDM
ncbi:sigma-70 family RNA polymerase sigma factor [candidate division TA06 bacterium]|uniref:RNA polymerase sigma factor n=1 Tax=candidate division TA06 bacterium TaxID=2250710 RepID=A0A523XK08_UNCT6|nr:MAG: sigma-70 family RNA polymerase sigma factor [candidate division TA06 bacterium]